MILKLQHKRVERLYKGGARIDQLVGKGSGENTLFSEDWIASDVAPGISLTDGGEPLDQLLEREGERILGENSVRTCGKRMPILAKLLDSTQRLAIQVHPTVAFAREHFHSPFGKTECWYMLDVWEDSGVYLGFKPGITKAVWQACFEKQEGLLDWLHWIPVKKGDCLYIPGGMPHAIGAGCFLAELQEPTDLIVIPERLGPSGQPVPESRMHGGLGFEKMLDCFTYEGLTLQEVEARCVSRPRTLPPGLIRLIGEPETAPFFMDKWMTGHGDYLLNGRLRTGLVLEGSGMINGKEMAQGDLLLISADEVALKASEGMTLLMFAPGDNKG